MSKIEKDRKKIESKITPADEWYNLTYLFSDHETLSKEEIVNAVKAAQKQAIEATLEYCKSRTNGLSVEVEINSPELKVA